MTLISYAQNFEDVILWRALRHVERGFYIDVGAQDPVVDSVSLAFYEKGWRGVHVEPIKHYADILRAARPDEEVIESAVGEATGMIDFWEIADTGLSTGNDALAAEYERQRRQRRAIKVPCRPLSELLDRYHDREVHWLKIDVEGMEGRVVKSWEPSEVRPWIVVIESTTPNSQQLTFADWEPYLIALGYDFVYFDGLNRFYISREHPELKKHFGPGPNLFDDFVLSGYANAPFCARINAEAARLREQAATLADETARLSKQVDELRAQAATQTEVFAKAVAVWEGAYAALNHELAERDQKIKDLVARAAELEAQHAALNHELAERDQKIKDLVARAAELETQLGWVYQSTSWRVTAPLRFVKRAAKWFAAGSWAWITLKPGSRPRRAARAVIIALADRILARPWLASRAKLLLANIPALENRLRSIVRTDAEKPGLSLQATGEVPRHEREQARNIAAQNVIEGISRLDLCAEPESVRELYQRLAQARRRAAKVA